MEDKGISICALTVLVSFAAFRKGWKIVKWSKDPRTWTDSPDMKRKRAMIAWGVHGIVQMTGQIFLSRALQVSPVTVICVYQTVWTNVIEFIVSHCIVSDRGLQFLRKRRYADAVRDAVKNMGAPSFQRSLLLIIMDMSLMSILLPSATSAMQFFKLPPFYPELLRSFMVASILGSGIQLSYGNLLRSEWVHGDPTKLEDGVLSALVVFCAVVYMGTDIPSPESVIETKNARVATVVVACVISYVMSAAPKRQTSKHFGRCVYAALTAACVAVIVKDMQPQRRWLSPILLGMFAPAF